MTKTRLRYSVGLPDGITNSDSDCTKKEVECAPLKSLTRHGYLCVTDIMLQHWCEQKLVYLRTVPLEADEEDHIAVGSDIHMARELEVHDIIEVRVNSPEDKWAIKLANLYQSLQSFTTGATIAREIPVFGFPYAQDVLVQGVIDELRFCPERYSIDIVELKTRARCDVPGASQGSQHKLQVQLYKKLFDDLVCGRVDARALTSNLGLDDKREFSSEVRAYLREVGLNDASLPRLLASTLELAQCFTKVDNLYIEYLHQVSHETIRHVRVEYDDDRLRNDFADFVRFWRGERQTRGVDIEDAWKCSRCEYSDICSWRRSKHDECVAINIARQRKT